MKYNYETVGTDCLIGLFFGTKQKGIMRIQQKINDNHYLCSLYSRGVPTPLKFVYSFEELREFPLSTNIDGVE